MRTYSNVISLTRNSRGVYSLDPFLGCSSGTKDNKNGCYNECYAARLARIYGYDFTKTIERNFKSGLQLANIRKQINRISLPFIRMGTMCDPSENWEHTLDICELIQNVEQYSLFEVKPKDIVIVTKHWQNLTDNQLIRLNNLNVCINTSISVLDNDNLFNNSIKQYKRLKKYCKSVLRIVSCNLNIENNYGKKLNEIQENIFNNYKVLDTIFRVSKNNDLVLNGIINIEETKFLGKKCNVSRYNKKAYFGKCEKCIEQCGIN